MPDYHRPGDLADALSWLAAREAGPQPPVIAAGCTDLFPATERRSLPGPVLDLTGISTLRGISRQPQGWRFGATTTWTDVIEADLPQAFDGLKAAAREVGSVQIQNAATLAGNLCNASPAADGVPCWLTLEAEVELTSAAGVRRMGVAEFLTGPRRTALGAGEILSAILVPARTGQGRSAFVKLGARRYLVISIAMVAARIEVSGGVISQAAIAVGACSPVALRLTSIERALVGQSAANPAFDPAQVNAALSPIDDIRGDGAYRTASAPLLIARAVRACLDEGAA